MDRTIWYSEEQARTFDFVSNLKDTLKGIARSAQASIAGGQGASKPILTGFYASQTTIPGLSINLTDGQVYQWAPVDATLFGAFPADATMIYCQGYAAAQTVTVNTSGMTPGQQQWWLIEAQFQNGDIVRPGDPTNGVLPYYNSANPKIPLQGPGGSGAWQPTVRQGNAVIRASAGNPASVGNAVPPQPSSGWVPMYLILLNQSTTQILTSDIRIAGPSAYAGFPVAPFCPGLIGQLPGSSGSHHGGVAGQAAKVLLTNAAEVQGVLSYTNMQVTNATPAGVGGVVTMAGNLSIHYQGEGSPAGELAGEVGDTYFDKQNSYYYECVTAGTSSTASWLQLGLPGKAIYVPYGSSPFVPQAGNYTYLCDSSGGAFQVNLLAASAMNQGIVTIINVGANQVVMTPQSGEQINNLGTGVSYTLNNKFQGIKLAPRSGFGYYISP